MRRLEEDKERRTVRCASDLQGPQTHIITITITIIIIVIVIIIINLKC